MSPTLPALRPVVLYQQRPKIQAAAKSPAACRRPPLRARYAMPAPPDPPSQDTGPASIREGRGETSAQDDLAPACEPRSCASEPPAPVELASGASSSEGSGEAPLVFGTGSGRRSPDRDPS